MQIAQSEYRECCDGSRPARFGQLCSLRGFPMMRGFAGLAMGQVEKDGARLRAHRVDGRWPEAGAALADDST